MKKFLKVIVKVLFFVVLLYVGVIVYKNYFVSKEKTVYSTSKIVRGDMQSSISATGTVEPEELVNIGAQVGGMITTLGKDINGREVDYCSEVSAGTVLANIDDSLYRASVNNSKAQKAQCEAAIKTAEANIASSEAKLVLAVANWRRAEKLNPQNVIAQSEYDSSKAEYMAALAGIESSMASKLQSEAQLAAAEASLESAQWNLNYCVISSPVDGVIIDRRVNIGQTVNSSMSAPSLFLIAKDLKRMEVWVSVNEADVGYIKIGQEAEFTVDAFAGRIFKGIVQKIRLNATMSQNVVTYVAEIFTDNSDGTLLPYLTANVNFILDRRENVLTVPNSAFRFSPKSSQVPLEFSDIQLGEGERLLWTLENNLLKPLPVKVGLNDGVNTEIIAGAQENTIVVTGASIVVSDGAPSGREDNQNSPFLPKMPSRGGKR